jgi:hypothetical protein
MAGRLEALVGRNDSVEESFSQIETAERGDEPPVAQLARNDVQRRRGTFADEDRSRHQLLRRHHPKGQKVTIDTIICIESGRVTTQNVESDTLMSGAPPAAPPDSTNRCAPSRQMMTFDVCCC